MTGRSVGALCAVIAAVVGVATAAPAAAHSALLSSDPDEDEVVEAAPDQVTLVFTEPPDPELSGVDVFDRTGEALDTGEIVPDDEGTTIAVDLPPLDDGVYTVSWQALSSVDGHLTTGAFVFTVGDAPEEDAGVAPAPMEAAEQGGPSPLGVAGRWTLYWGLALLLGWALAGLVVFRASPPGPAWAVLACSVLTVVGLGLIGAAEANAVDVPARDFFASATGSRLVRVGILVGVTVVAAVLAALRRGPLTAGLLAAASLAAMFAHAAAGHAGAPGDLRWLSLSSQWVHIAAIGAWIGGLVWLLAGLRSRSGQERVDPVTRFSTLATVALGLVVLTGVWRAIEGVGNLEALWSSGYGIALIVKLAIVVPLIALGAVNRFRNVPAIARGESHHRRLRNVVRSEVAFAAVVFGVTGVLAGLPPPGDGAAPAAHEEHEMGDPSGAAEAIEVTGSDFGTSVEITLRVEPGAVGENRFAVRVADYDTGETIEASRVALDFSIPDRPEVGTTRLELEPAEDGWWEAESTAVAQPGRWEALAIVAYDSEGVEVPLEFEVGPGQ